MPRPSVDMSLFWETDDRFYVARSTLPNAGRGLFAKKALAKGDLHEVLGVLVPIKSVSNRVTQFAHFHKILFSKKYVLVPTGYAGMVNHSYKPNMTKVWINERLYLQALRPISKGEEIFISYHRYRAVAPLWKLQSGFRSTAAKVWCWVRRRAPRQPRPPSKG